MEDRIRATLGLATEVSSKNTLSPEKIRRWLSECLEQYEEELQQG
jgi:hypothetical protein